MYRLDRPIINGKRSDKWYVCWTEGRRSHRVSAKTTDKVRAQAFLAQFEAIQAAPPESFDVADLCDAYLAERIEAGVKYPKAIANSLRHIKAAIGQLPPSMWSRATNRSYIQQRQRLVMGSTVDKELRFLRQAFKFGVREGWMDKEPAVDTPGPSSPRQRFLTREEFARIYFHASPLHLRTFLALAIFTLARGKHILALTWEQVDYGRHIIWYKPHDPRSKKRTQSAWIGSELEHALRKAQEAATSPWVVEWSGKRVMSVRKAYERAVARSGVEDAHKHDIRRTGASWAIQDGQSFDVVATLLGDTVDMTKKTYAIFSPSYLRGVVESIATGSGGR